MAADASATRTAASGGVAQIRDLARRVAEFAHSDDMQAMRDMWRRHNSLEKVERPMVMCCPVGAWVELVPASSLVATDPLHREIERTLRMRLYKATVGDDTVIEPWVDVHAVHLGEERPMMWGVNIDVRTSGQSRGSFAFKPEIKEESDIEKLRIPEWGVDEKATQERYQKACHLLDGILDVRLTYGRLGGAGLAYWGSYLRGLEQMMYDCLDRPEWFHRFVKFMSDATIQHMKGLEADGHVVRNDNGVGLAHCDACRELPRPDFDGEHVRLVDTLGGGDSQEFSLVSPEIWEEFLLTHQIPIFRLYGMVHYGCCESLVGKVDILRKKVPNLRRISVSPWSDIAHSAEHCEKRVILQIRPKPTDVLFSFTEEDMRKDIVEKMEQAGESVHEFRLQDIETVDGRPETLPTWTRIAKEVGAELYHH